MIQAFAVSILFLFTSLSSSAVEVKICEDGKAVYDIITAPDASPRTRAAADELAGMLSRISGASFRVATGKGATGIVLGTTRDFPEVTFPQPKSPFSAPEQYLLESHKDGLRIIGRSDIAVENGVWDLLERLGVRQFFPGEAWEVLPTNRNLKIDVNAVCEPDYALRMIWFGWGSWPENEKEMKTWERRNRANSGFDLQTGHAYEFIVAERKEVFAAHPEYYAMLKGSREHDHSEEKMCISNPAVQKLVVDWCLEWLEKHPEADSVSAEPSDGGGWCECGDCEAIGSPSDRALLLANHVAEAMEKRFPDKYVAMYAYYKHGPAPTRTKAHPRVIVSVATAFLLNAETPTHLITGWKEAGIKQFGIREYYSVTAWDRDLPGAVNGGKLAYLRTTIPQFHEMGARFMSAESGDNWGPYGLNYYLAGNMLWDVKNASRLDELKEDFFTKAFGPAREPIKAFYTRIDGAARPMLSADLLGRMYCDIVEAMKLAGTNEAVIKRIAHLTLYTRYLELFRQYTSASGSARQQAFEALIRHSYRMRSTHMTHSLGLWRDLPDRDHAVKVPEDANWDLPEGKNIWKSSEPWKRDEIDAMLRDGVERNRIADFTPVSFSQDLVPVSFGKPSATPGLWQNRGDVRYATWFDRANVTLELKVTGGLTGYRDRGDVKLRLIPAGEVQGRAVSEAQVPPDGQTHEVKLHSNDGGLHWLEVSDGHDATRIEWKVGLFWTSPLAMTERFDASSQPLVFYVPKGTKTVGGYAKVLKGAIVNPSGEAVAALSPAGEYFSIPVRPGEDGKLWSVNATLYDGTFMLLTVPPYVARNGDELLLPKEVAQADKLTK